MDLMDIYRQPSRLYILVLNIATMVRNPSPFTHTPASFFQQRVWQKLSYTLDLIFVFPSGQ